VADIRHARSATRQQLRTGNARAVAHHEFTTWSGLPVDGDREEPWLPAVSLLTGDQRYVPAAAVYPFSWVNRDLAFEPSSAGAGAAATMPEAIGEGLLSALAYAALRDAVSGRRLAQPILVDSAEIGSELDFLLRTARNLDLPFELLDLTGYPAHVVLATAEGGDGAQPWFAVGASLSQRRSVVEALRDLIGAVQLRQQFGSGTPDDFGDPLLAGLAVRAIGRGTATGHGLAGPTAPQWTVDEVLDKLRSTGRDAFAVNTSTPDLAAGDVVTVRVLLTAAPC
jgi:ribosomal protein S12 methylthiotransferase accessory factor YcaO